MTKLADRPTVGRLTIPFVVDERNDPIRFVTLDTGHVARCAEEGLCGICGGKIRRGPIAFIGPDDGRTCFADAWMHPDCADVAMAQCPFLAGRRDWRDPEARVDPLTARYSAGMALFLASNWRSHLDEFDHWHFEALGPLERAHQQEPTVQDGS